MAIAAALCTMSGPQVREAHAAPAGLSQQRLDLELREVEVKNVFKLLGEVGGRKLQLDPCVTGTVDIKLKNTPVPMVFDALASKLGLVYEDQGGDAGKEDARLATKVSVTVKEAALQSVLEMLASSAKLDGVDYRATSRPKVTITLEGVRVSTALAALADGTNLKLGVARGKLVVSD
jgi:hypothetical protein